MGGWCRQEPLGFRQSNLAWMTLLHWGVRLTWATSVLNVPSPALIHVTVQEPGQDGPHYFLILHALYGLDSAPVEVRGRVLAPQRLRGALNLQGCDPETHFQVPPDLKQWIALLQRGNCTFKEKISRAAFHDAVAAVIYNDKNERITLTHEGPGNIVTVMITESEGNNILRYLEKNASVEMTISHKTSVQSKTRNWILGIFLPIYFVVVLVVLPLTYYISHNI